MNTLEKISLPWVCRFRNRDARRVPALETGRPAYRWVLSAAPRFLLLSVSAPIVICAVNKTHAGSCVNYQQRNMHRSILKIIVKRNLEREFYLQTWISGMLLSMKLHLISKSPWMLLLYATQYVHEGR